MHFYTPPSKHGQDITIQAIDEIWPFASAWQVPSPTCADAPDDTRLEFKDFKKRAQSLASVAWRNTRATETGAKGWRHPSWPRISAAQQLQDIPTSMYRYVSVRIGIFPSTPKSSHESHPAGWGPLDSEVACYLAIPYSGWSSNKKDLGRPTVRWFALCCPSIWAEEFFCSQDVEGMVASAPRLQKKLNLSTWCSTSHLADSRFHCFALFMHIKSLSKWY